jgi:hypothetical protein
MANDSVDAQVHTAMKYLRAASFTDVQEVGTAESDVRVIRMTWARAARALKPGISWLRANKPVEVSDFLDRRDVATLLREGEGGVEIRDSTTIHHYRLQYPH